jgi:predicted N-acetyltransferase YhbS
MRLQTVPQSAVTPDLDAQVRALQIAAFPQTAEFRLHRYYRHRPRPGDVLLLAWDGERLVAEVALYWAWARIDGSPDALRLACIGNVCSDPGPDVRGRGHASACVERALQEARAGRADHALLFCRLTLQGYYARFGFRTVDNVVRLTRSDGTTFVSGHQCGMALDVGAAASWPAGRLVLDVDDF